MKIKSSDDLRNWIRWQIGKYLAWDNFRHLKQFSNLPLPDKSKFEIVVAKYKEDIRWSECVHNNVTIYSKLVNDLQQFISLPNIGREYGTYLHHMITNYDHLADKTLFVQGAPFEHVLFPWPCYYYGKNDFISGLNAIRLFASPHIWYVHPQTQSSILEESEAQIKKVLSSDVKLAFWNECVGNEPVKFIRYGWGAQFCLSKEIIQKKGLINLKKLYEMSQSEEVVLANEKIDNYRLGVLFEMFWPYIFGAHTFSEFYKPRRFLDSV